MHPALGVACGTKSYPSLAGKLVLLWLCSVEVPIALTIRLCGYPLVRTCCRVRQLLDPRQPLQAYGLLNRSAANMMPRVVGTNFLQVRWVTCGRLVAIRGC